MLGSPICVLRRESEGSMEREPLSYYITVNLTARDRQALEQIADQRGATLSGIVRRLIRNAAQDFQEPSSQPEEVPLGQTLPPAMVQTQGA